ncbi:MAG: DUF1559 domain-containing protein [Zavarzinella sp.]
MSRRAFSLVELLVIIAIIAILAGLIIPAVQRVRSASERTICINQLKQLGLAFHSFHASHGSFPPGSTSFNDPHQPLLGWVPRISPHFEQDKIWQRAVVAYQHSPWHLQQVAGYQHPDTEQLRMVSCPSDPRFSDFVCRDPEFELPHSLTSYIAVSGEAADRTTGVMYIDSKTRIADITDGTSTTLLVGERPPSKDNRYGWWYSGLGLEGLGTADMHLGVHEINSYPKDNYKDCSLGPYQYSLGDSDNICSMFHYWSFHTGGANFLMCDGSVRMIRYAGNSSLLSLATRASQDIVNDQ